MRDRAPVCTGQLAENHGLMIVEGWVGLHLWEARPRGECSVTGQRQSFLSPVGWASAHRWQDGQVLGGLKRSTARSVLHPDCPAAASAHRHLSSRAAA